MGGRVHRHPARLVPDGHGGGDGVGGAVDDRDRVPAEIGDVDGVSGRVHCHPDRRVSDGHGGGDGVGGAVDHRDGVAASIGDVDGVGGRVHGHRERGPFDGHGGGDGVGGAVDDRDRVPAEIGDVDGVGGRVHRRGVRAGPDRHGGHYVVGSGRARGSGSGQTDDGQTGEGQPAGQQGHEGTRGEHQRIAVRSSGPQPGWSVRSEAEVTTSRGCVFVQSGMLAAANGRRRPFHRMRCGSPAQPAATSATATPHSISPTPWVR